ncbi:MAG: hypothetical protein HY299_23000 [Verrucomicrobia bacterium]|nr:hypothetical protein [Verrucomicrobiota bacterium]
MITLAPFCVMLFAASLPLIYIAIIHGSLSGPAANDPSFDVNAPKRTTTDPGNDGKSNSLRGGSRTTAPA